VLTAGVFMNILLVVVLFSAVLMAPHEEVVGTVIIEEVTPGSPAEVAGLRPGDVVLRADGHPIGTSLDLVYRVHLRLGAESHWDIQRGLVGESPIIEKVTVVPRWRWPAGQGPTGISIEDSNLTVVTVSEPFWEAIPQALQRTGESLVLMKNEVTRWVIGAARPQVAGPIGIAQVTDQVADAGFLPLLSLVAALSLTLAVLNILPFPMLDGGRLAFVLLEWVRRGKRISPQREGLVHMVGFALLMTLIVVISYQDILRIIRGESLLQ
jgi:regulator of sigma E protease